MKRKNILYTLLAGLMIVFLGSCQKEELVGGTATKDMSGDWFVQLDGAGDYYHFSTYNTAANSSTEMFIDDLKSFWEMKGKVAINQSNMTFSGAAVGNTYYESKFTLTDGVILKNAAKAAGSKAKTDSIRFKVTFSDDKPANGNVYTFSGYKRTGFLEDEH